MRIQPGPFTGSAYRQAISGSGRMNKQERAQAEASVLTYLAESVSGAPFLRGGQRLQSGWLCQPELAPFGRFEVAPGEPVGG